ncbi:MAG: phosphatidate cytidylyltransferase [Holosporales bacterium]|jgi:phosphatidate cytidylyltransferase|nr:phosphatidate cytidylyltransferase [Holosporales bacterium]
MANNLLMRIINGIALAGAGVWIILNGGCEFFLSILLGFFIMLYEWIKINKRKKKKYLLYSGIVYITIPALFLIIENYKDNTYYDISYKLYILWIFFIVWSCDIFAYFGGKLIGGLKFAPKISPNKTWSGVLAGSVFSILTSYFYVYNVLNNNAKLFYASILITISAVLGDLLESKVKRILNVKDTGNIIPGHGGLCDRLDSLFLATYSFILIKIILL